MIKSNVVIEQSDAIRKIKIDVCSNEEINKYDVQSVSYLNWLVDFLVRYNVNYFVFDDNLNFEYYDHDKNIMDHINGRIFRYFVDYILSELNDSDKSKVLFNQQNGYGLFIKLKDLYYIISYNSEESVYAITKSMPYDSDHWIVISY